MSDAWKEGLHEILDLFPVIIFTIFFCNWKTFAICRAVPEYKSPWEKEEGKIIELLGVYA